MKYSFTLLLAVFALLGCSEEEIDRYDTSLTALKIWVGTHAGAVYE